jgi:hypothetical protein
MTNQEAGAALPIVERELVGKLRRFIAMPEWPRFYMDKEQAQLCVDALLAKLDAGDT